MDIYIHLNFPSSCDSWAPVALLMSGFTTLRYKWPHSSLSLSEFVNVLSKTAWGWTCEFYRCHVHSLSSAGPLRVEAACPMVSGSRREVPMFISKSPLPPSLFFQAYKMPAMYLTVHSVILPHSHIQLQIESLLILHEVCNTLQLYCMLTL